MIPLKKFQGLSIAQQAYLLRHSIPETKVKADCRKLICELHARPTEMSREYRLQISYELGKHPDAIITSPDLGVLTQDKIPHLWSADPYKLCLYYYKNREWNPRMHLSRTIFPWSMEWLFHFECWLATGHWDGGGTTH